MSDKRFEEFNGKIGKVDFDSLHQKKSLYGYRMTGEEHHKVVYQENETLLGVENFRLSYECKSGMGFNDGSRLLIKGWLKIIRVGDYYQLVPRTRSFSFNHNLGTLGLSNYQTVCDSKILATREQVLKSYLIDNERKIIYEVEESVFGGDPKSFDLFKRTKQIALFKKDEEIGFIDYNGKFHSHSPMANTKIDSIAKWWLSRT